RLDGGEAGFLGVEHPGRPLMQDPLVPGELDDGAFGGEVPAQDRETAGRLERVVPRHNDVLAGALVRAVGNLAQGAPVDAGDALVDEAAAHELARDERDAAGLEEIRCDIAAAGLD